MVLPLLGGLLGTALAGTGALGGIAAGLSPLVASSLGSGLGAFIETGDLKKAAMTGLGGLAGGALLGGVAGNLAGGGANAAAAAGQAGQQAAQQTAMNAGQAAASAPQGIFSMGNMKSMLTDPAKMQGMIGAAVGPAMMYDPNLEGKGGGKHIPQQPGPGRSLSTRGMAPGYGMGEFDFRVQPNYGLNQGGMVGMDEAPTKPTKPTKPPSEKEVIADAISAIEGRHPTPEMALARFVQVYGEDALMALVDSVSSGGMAASAKRSEGMVEGPPVGRDMVPAKNVDSGMDLLLEDGEYIMPKTATQNIGKQNLDQMRMAYS